MVVKKCVVCGKEFTAKTNRAKYCSSHCRNRSRYFWSAEDLRKKREELKNKIIKLYDSPLSTKEIAASLGKHPSQINEVWRNAGLPKRLTTFQKQVSRLRDQGKCCVEIAKELGVDPRRIPPVARAVGKPFSAEEVKRSISLSRANQFCKRTEDERRDYVEQFLGGRFSYVSGYKDSDSMVTIRCNKCGEVFERSMVSIRHNRESIICPTCAKKELAKKEEQKRLEAKKAEAIRLIKRAQKKRDRLLKLRIVTCPVCGKTFSTMHRNATYCSDKCRKKAGNYRKDNRIKKEKRIDGGITAKALYERDNGVCWICGEKCDINDYVVKDGTIICGNNYPSVDHVIPICEGGEDSWSNVRLAHRGCNSARYWREHA